MHAYTAVFSSDPLPVANLEFRFAPQVLPFFESLGFKLPDRKVISRTRKWA